MQGLRVSINQIQQRIDAALKKSPHHQKRITIVGASKSQSINAIRDAFECGIQDMGENYAQELVRKASMAQDIPLKWRFIGHLQSNKAKLIVPYVSSIDTVDSLELAERIGRLTKSIEGVLNPMPILVQVNIGKEKQKSGLPAEVVCKLAKDFSKVEGVVLKGLMGITPVTNSPGGARLFYKELRKCFDIVKADLQLSTFDTLSMGMSQDFDTAIEEGSTMVRIGTALFGERPQQEVTS